MNDNDKVNTEKFSIDTEPNDSAFDDPVMRCDSCNKIVKRRSLHKVGACPHCGNKRIRNLTTFNELERDQMVEWGFQDFVNEYEEVDDE